MHIRIATCLMILFARAALGDVQVEILNLPDSVFSTEPIPVLYEIRNNGSEWVNLPNEGSEGRGIELYWSRNGQEMRPIRKVVAGFSTPHAVRSMWLAPGERWLYLDDIGSSLGVKEGRVALQAVLSSSGVCGTELSGGRESRPFSRDLLQTVQAGEHSIDMYLCWQGDVRSSMKWLTVALPDSAADREAEAFLRSKRKIREDVEKGLWTISGDRELWERFPESRYSYGVLAKSASSLDQKIQAIQLQPQNELNPWVAAAALRQAADQRSSCWVGPRIAGAEVLERFTLPAGVRDFLDQYAWERENRVCPRMAAAKR